MTAERIQAPAGTGGRVGILRPDDLGSSDALGWSVAISGQTVAVGAPMHDFDGVADTGALFVFKPDQDGVWRPGARVIGFDTAAGDNFGISVALEGGTTVVGAYRDDDAGFGSGSAYLLDVSETLPFADGFESGDTSAWSAAVP
jgi:hypothetical protein